MSSEKFIKNNTVLITLISACLIVIISLGIRQTFGMFYFDFSIDLEITLSQFGFAMGLQMLLWGVFGPYVYHWMSLQGDTLQSSQSPIALRDTLFDLASGTYILHIYDDKNCLIDYTLNVPEPAVALSIDSLSVIEGIACHGDSVGKAIVYKSGGQPNYSYLWDNGETTHIANNLTSGYHSILLTDDWGCEVSDSIEIPENTLIESDLVVDTTVSCYGASDGVAVISTLGGSSVTYTYFWSQGQYTTGVNYDIATGLLYGSYYVTTRDDLGCEVVDSVYISQPEPLTMEASELDWVDCYNDSTGEAFATATGGTSPYTFDWSNGMWTGDTVNTLAPGLHTVIVTDARGCTSSDTVFIHNPDSLYIQIDHSQTILPYCEGINTAELSAIAYGGTLGYTYEWNDNPVLPQTTATASGLLSDNYYSSDSAYTITVTDSKGCIASVTTDTLRFFTETMYVMADSLLSQYASGSLDSNEVSCFGFNDGSAYAFADGGHGPYTYQWYGPGLFNSTNSVITNLYAGTYSVTVRDTNNCMVNTSVVLVEPAPLTFNTSGLINESCLGACDGAIIVDSLLGGVAPYSALLTDNQTGSVTTNNVSLGMEIVNVCSGDFNIVLTDVNNCPSSVIAGGINHQVVGYDAYTEAQIDASTSTTLICNASSDGSLEVLNPQGLPYTYSWLDIFGNTIASTNNLPAGIYVLYAGYNNTDGCTTTDTIQITELAPITSTAAINDVDCYGNNTGVITAAAAGTVGPYSYSWDNGSNGATASGLEAGSYIVTVEDANDCENTFVYTVDQPDELDVSIINNGYVLDISTAGVTGGVQPYTYAWFELSSPSSMLTAGITYTVSSIGSYYLEVTDANGCLQTSNMISFGTTSITDLLPSTLNVYPNPFTEETTVDFGSTVKQASIRLVDVYGKIIEDYTIENTDKYIIKRNNKAKGIYFLEVQVGDSYITNIKVVIDG